jgi:hypothetical protein
MTLRRSNRLVNRRSASRFPRRKRRLGSWEVAMEWLITTAPESSRPVADSGLDPATVLGHGNAQPIASNASRAGPRTAASRLRSATGGALCQMVVTRRPERTGRVVLTSCDYRDNFPLPMLKYFKLAATIPGAMKLLMLPMRLLPRTGSRSPSAGSSGGRSTGRPRFATASFSPR